MPVATNAAVYSKTSIGGFYFDAVVYTEHSSDLQITKHPTETGADVVDHSFLEPRDLKMEVVVSDTISKTNDQFRKGATRAIGACDVLYNLQSKRVPFSVFTRFRTYENMLIKSIEIREDRDTIEQMRAVLVMVEIPTARLQIVKLSADAQTTGSTQAGNIEPSPATEGVRESLLYQLLTGS